MDENVFSYFGTPPPQKNRTRLSDIDEALKLASLHASPKLKPPKASPQPIFVQGLQSPHVMRPATNIEELHVEIKPEVQSALLVKFYEEQLYAAVLTKPLFRTPDILQALFGLGPDLFLVNTAMHVLEIAFAIATIVLCLDSINNDRLNINNSVWSYLIALSGILLGILVLFLFKVMNFEHNNGIFYCLTGCGLSISAMGIGIGILLPTECTSEFGQLRMCHFRRAETSLVCIAAILWIINLVQFITVFYISRLDLARSVELPVGPPQPIFGYIPPEPPAHKTGSIYSKRDSNPRTLVEDYSEMAPEEPVNVKQEQTLKYTLDEAQGLHRLDETEIPGKKKVMLYQ